MLGWDLSQGHPPRGSGGPARRLVSLDIPWTCALHGLRPPCMASDLRGPEELARPSPEATSTALMKVLSPAQLLCSPASQAPPLPVVGPIGAASDLPFPPGLSSPLLGAAGPEVAGMDGGQAASGPEDSGLVGPCLGTPGSGGLAEVAPGALDAAATCSTVWFRGQRP
jgi:hypothetical protein